MVAEYVALVLILKNTMMLKKCVILPVVLFFILLSACAKQPVKSVAKVEEPQQETPKEQHPVNLFYDGIYKQRIEMPTRLIHHYFKFFENQTMLALFDFKGSAQDAANLFARLPKFMAKPYRLENNQIVTQRFVNQQLQPQHIALNAQGQIAHSQFINTRVSPNTEVEFDTPETYQIQIYHAQGNKVFEVEGHQAVALAHESIRISNHQGQQLYNLQGKPQGEVYEWIATEFVKGTLLAYKDNRFGLIDKNGKILVPFAYDKIDYKHQDTSILATLNGYSTLYTESFKVVLHGRFYQIGARSIKNIVPIKRKSDENWRFFSLKKRGWLNFNAPEYAALNSPDYFQVTTSRGSILLNHKGKPSLSMYFSHAQVLNDNTFLIKGLTGMTSRFNKKGKRLMPFFKETLTPLGQVIKVEENNQVGLVNFAAQEITPLSFDKVRYLGDGLYRFENEQKKISLYSLSGALYKNLDTLSPLVNHHLLLSMSEGEKHTHILWSTENQKDVYRTQDAKLSQLSNDYVVYTQNDTGLAGVMDLDGSMLTQAIYTQALLKGRYLLASKEGESFLYALPNLEPITTVTNTNVELFESKTVDGQGQLNSYAFIYNRLEKETKNKEEILPKN